MGCHGGTGQRNLHTRQRNVDELIQTTGTQQSRVDLIGTVGSADDEYVLLCVHTIHLSKNLVQNTVTSTSTIASAGSTRFRDGVQFIEEHDTRCRRAGLVEDVTDVGFGFTEPHSEKFGTLRSREFASLQRCDHEWRTYLDADEVCLTFVGNRLREQGLSTTRRPVEEDTFAGVHTELQELLRVFDRVLHGLLKFLLDLLQTTNIVPSGSGDFDDGLTKRGWVGGTESVLKTENTNQSVIRPQGVQSNRIHIDRHLP